jgi:nitrate/nitrite-specific signal transduction histidine kinase
LPEDFDELPDDEKQEIIADLEEAVASFDPNDLREEIAELSALISLAKPLERNEIEVKVVQPVIPHPICYNCAFPIELNDAVPRSS